MPLVALDRPATTPSHRRGRGLLVLGAVASSAVIAAGVTFLVLNRPPAPVSVPDVIQQYRSAHPTPQAVPSGRPAAPRPGVYVYATTGTESISAGVKHTYPPRTTLTVTQTSCGLQARWDALQGRWQQWQLCAAPGGWQLRSYVEAHKFLYMQDIHRYRCSSNDWSTSTRDVRLTCDTGSSVLTVTGHTVGVTTIKVGPTAVPAVHVHIDQRATGSSTSIGTADLWLQTSSGLPVQETVHDTGTQVVLGSRITYRETATFRLESLQPRG